MAGIINANSTDFTSFHCTLQPSKLKFLFSGHLAISSLGLVARGNF